MTTMKPSKIRKVFNKHVRIGMSFDVTDNEGKTITLYVASAAFVRKGEEAVAYCADVPIDESTKRTHRPRTRPVPCGLIISKLFAKETIPDEDPA